MIEFVMQTRAESPAVRSLTKAVICLLGEYIGESHQLHDFDLVLTEACANVVNHAYRGAPAGELEIRTVLEPGRSVRFEVSDWGRGFDLNQRDIDFPPPSSESGRGLGTMSRLSDNFSQRLAEGKHTIIISKNVSATAWTTSR